MTSPADAERGIDLDDLKRVLAEHKQRHARQAYPFCEDFGCMDVEPLVAEIERLRQREAGLRRAIAHEHQRSNGSSVYMQGPPQHERSRLTCKHPLCAALAQADAQQPVDDSAPAS